MDKRDVIKEQVIKVLWTFKPRVKEITGSMCVIKDLRLISDDATEAAVTLQKLTGAKPPLGEWSKVSTVDEIVDLLLKYAP